MPRLKDSSEFLETLRLLQALDVPLGPTEPTPAPGRLSRGDRLQAILAHLCASSGLAGAAVTDAHGLPLAVCDSPLPSERLAAFTSVLGTALAQAARLLQQPTGEYLTLELDARRQLLLRRFALEQQAYFLVALGSRGLDPRPALEVACSELLEALQGPAEDGA